MTSVLPLSVLPFHYKKSGSLVAAQLRISIILNYDERRENSVGFPSTFLDLTISLLPPYELSHTPCADMIRESDSVLCVVILWIIYFNFSLEPKHVSACFWNSVWAPVTWAFIFQQALILRRQHSVLTAFRVWWREKGGGGKGVEECGEVGGCGREGILGCPMSHEGGLQGNKRRMGEG